jgi:glucose/arabinose dehydrogenase
MPGRIARGCLLAVCLGIAGCYALAGSSGGGQARPGSPRRVAPSDVALPDGYAIDVVAEGLTFPTGVAFDQAGRVHVVESGYAYGEVFDVPRLLRLEPDGTTTVVATGEHAPWTGVVHRAGSFYIAEGGEVGGGRILAIGTDGRARALVENLPSLGDHHTNGPAIGPDGWLYFAQGTATNSGVVGEDNAEFGWLRRHPAFSDVPCRDVRLRGVNFTTRNPLADGGSAVTGAYVPFGTPTQPEQVVPGRVPCGGSVMRVPLRGGAPELVAWGLRNPFGLAFAPDGRLFVTENGYDVRGSRPVFGAEDVLWAIEPGRWYGWPDHAAGRRLDDERFRPPGGQRPELVLADHPDRPPAPIARFGVSSSSNGIDFSRSSPFGHVGEAFVAQFGDMAPKTGKVLSPVGFKVVRVDVGTGVVRDFAVNRGSTNGPASWLGKGGLERPVSVRFDPSATALYVVDFGVMTMSRRGPAPVKGTGVVWRIVRTGDAR